MPFFDQPAWPHHCGNPIAAEGERELDPTDDEARQGISRVGVTLARCRQSRHASGEPCRVRWVFTRHRYSGGWGPVHRVRDSAQIAGYIQRLKIARESDWVWGWHEETYAKTKRTVR